MGDRGASGLGRLVDYYPITPLPHCPLPIAHCSLPIAYCPLPIAHCPLPIAPLPPNQLAFKSKYRRLTSSDT
jgi:hypothetical protein